MEHLNEHTLARLVDEEPTGEQRAHLNGCALCREELAAFREQTDELGDLPAIVPPAGDWRRLSERLRAEGLIRPGARSGKGFWTAPAFQVAAALVLFLGGAILGSAMPPRAGASSDGDRLASGGETPARLVSEAASPEEAAEALFIAEREYYDALLAYRQKVHEDGEDAYSDPAARYAALEAVAAAARAAIREAPADPFLNGLLVSTAAEREATLDRMARTRGSEWF